MDQVLQGRVISIDGAGPVANASVAVVDGPAPAPDLAALTDGDGRFALSCLAMGRWRVRAYGPGGGQGEAVIELPQRYDAEITLHGELSVLERN